MSQKGILFHFLTARYLESTALNVWSGRKINHTTDSQKVLDRWDIRTLLEMIWEDYHQDIDQMSKQANIGNWLTMNSAYLTLSAYRVLIQIGLNRENAIALIQDLTWQITSTWTRRVGYLSKFLFREQRSQLRIFVDLLMNTFFSRPGYEFEKGPSESGFYLDVLRCPVADLMKSEEVPDLCIAAWCNVDFGLVEILGGKLIRSGTIAMGREKCDFRFH